MKKLLSLLMSYVMLFNLTMSTFAQNAGSLLGNNKIAESQERLKKEKAKFDIYANAIDNTIKYNQNTAEAKMQADQEYMKEVRKELVEASSSQDQKVAESLGANFKEFQDNLIAYAKENNIPLSELNIMESWQDHVKALNDYNNDYMILSRKLDPLKYTTVLNNAQKMLAGNGTRIKFEDREYDKVAFLHASIHNLAARTKSGFTKNGTWIWSDKVAEDFTLEQRLSVMDLIYEVIAKEWYHPDDRQLLWAFAYKIVEEGQIAFEQPLQGTRFTEVYQKEKESQANSVALAMAVLPEVSSSDTEKKQSADIIYTRIKETLSSQQATVSLLTGTKALIALNTKDTPDYLMTLLTKDCRNSYFKGSFGLLLDSFSAEEWANRFSDASTRIKKNYGRYNNSASARFTYVYLEKNEEEINSLLEDNSKEAFATLVYTNIFEEIGRDLGRNASHPNILPVVNIITNTYINDNQDKLTQQTQEEESEQKKESEEPGFWTKVTAVAVGFVAGKHALTSSVQNSVIDKVKDDVSLSIVSGILETTKSKNASLTSAAELIYNGSWWDINEPTQRAKNNIAAAYLGKQAKEYDKDKDNEFRVIYTAKKVANVADVAIGIVMIGALVAAAPKIISAVVSLPGKTIRGIKTATGAIKNVKITASKKVPTYSSNVRATAVSATTAEPSAVSAATRTAPASTTAAPRAVAAQTVEASKTEAAATSLPQAAKTTSEAAQKAQVIEQTKAQTQQALSQVEEAIFGKQGRVAAMQFVPGLPMDFMRGEISFSQLLNRSPQIRSIYNAAVKSTMKAIETQGLTLEEAKAFFMKNFESRLNMSLLITDSRAASVVEKAGQAFGGSLDSAKATEAAAAAKPTNSALMQRGFDTRDIEEFNKLGLLEGENYSKVEALLEKGVDKMDIYRAGKGGTLEELYKNQVVVASRSSALTQMGLEARDIEYFTKAGLLEDANYSKVEALLKKGVDKMDIYRAGKNGTLGELYNSKVVANSSSGAAGTAAARGSAYSGGQASSFFEESAGTGPMPTKGPNNPVFKSGLDGSMGSAAQMVNRMSLKPKYIAAKADANTVGVMIETEYGQTIPITLSHEALTILSRGDRINLGYVTLGKDTMRFLENVAKFSPDIANHLQATKKISIFERIFSKKPKDTIASKATNPAKAYENAYHGGVVELNENELVRVVGNGGKSVNSAYIQTSKDARKYMIDAVESGQYTASTDSYIETMNEMHKVSANGKSGNLEWYKDAGQGRMAVNPGEVRTGGRPRNSRVEQAKKVEEIAKKYGDSFRVKGNSSVDLPGITSENLPINTYSEGKFYHYYPKGGDALRPYYQQMHRTAEEAVALINQQAPEREILEKLAEHYQYAANARPYGQINNSLFMNEINTLLQKAGLRPMPHGELDIAAMHLQPSTFKQYFVDTYYRTRL